MSSFLRRGACAAIVAVMTVTAVAPAVAQGRNDRDRYVEDYYRSNPRDDDYRRWRDGRWDSRDYQRWYDRHHRKQDNRDAAAAAIFGLAAGALGAGAAQGGGRGERAPEARRSGPPPAGGYEPFSKGYDRYCSNKYRSFDPDTGTYVGRDGQERYCQ